MTLDGNRSKYITDHRKEEGTEQNEKKQKKHIVDKYFHFFVVVPSLVPEHKRETFVYGIFSIPFGTNRKSILELIEN